MVPEVPFHIFAVIFMRVKHISVFLVEAEMRLSTREHVGRGVGSLGGKNDGCYGNELIGEAEEKVACWSCVGLGQWWLSFKGLHRRRLLAPQSWEDQVSRLPEGG